MQFSTMFSTRQKSRGYTEFRPASGNEAICKVLPFPAARNRTEGKEESVMVSTSRKLKSNAPDFFKLKVNTTAIHPSIEIAQ